MSASVNTKHEVAVSILSGNVDVSTNNGKMIFTVSSSDSVLHAASKLEAIGLALVGNAKLLQEQRQA